MCLICTEWAKNPMSYNELRRNFTELNDGSAHAESLAIILEHLEETVSDPNAPVDPTEWHGLS